MSTKISIFLLVAVSATSVPVISAEHQVAHTLLPEKQLSTFFGKHCVRCHGPEKQNGRIRFDTISYEITGNDTAQRWQDILDILNGGNMPPEDEPGPTNDELASVLESLTDSILLAKKRLTDHGGEITMRRLNRREYAGTIRDLFGFNLPEEWVPEDEVSDVFDTVGADQYFSSFHFEKYLELGRKIIVHGFEWSAEPRKEPTTSRRDPEEKTTPNLTARLADLDEKMRLKNEGKTWKEMGFKDEGEMNIIFSQFKNRAGKPRQYLQLPLIDTGAYFVDSTVSRGAGANHSSDPRAYYVFRIHGGINGEPADIRKFVKVEDSEGIVGVLKIEGTTAEPETVEFRYTPNVGSRNFSLNVRENRNYLIRQLDSYIKKVDEGGEWGAIWVDYASTEGPFYEQDRSFFEQLTYPDIPQGTRKSTPQLTDGNAKEVIERFAYEAFRHQKPNPEYLDRLVSMYDENREAGMDVEKSLVDPLAVILASPRFLYLQETGAVDEPRRRLDDREFAIRLAYFLWSSPPDAELYACAENGSLSDHNVLSAQVDRMLDDPKADAFYNGFMAQWSKLKRFEDISVNPDQFFRFNDGIQYSARREVIEFFKTMVDENLAVASLIDSDFVMINSLLAEHYGIEGIESDEFQKVNLSEDSPRGGLLGQAAFLTMGSTGERSSPVIRGALVMEMLLNDKPAPPPPNVPELDQATDKPLPIRDIVKLHQTKPQCASCHVKMDAIGFGLENFDAIGKWRDTETVGRKEVPISPSGTLPGGGEFADLNELKDLLIQNKESLAQSMIESLLSYGLGRTVEFSDAENVEQMVEELQTENFLTRSMIHKVVASPLFRTK